MKQVKSRILLWLFLICAQLASAQDRVALLELSPAGDDPRLAYLEPLVEGLLLYDLGELGKVDLVERKNLKKILVEQEFQTSGFTGEAAVQTGKLAGARYLLTGNYGLAEGEVILNLQLTDAQTGEVYPVRERDRTEHVVHRASEKLIRRITGRTVVIADSTNRRSLVSLRDETPGTLVLHSRIEGAKIFIDGEFAGFTQGDERKPLVFENLPPGRHRVSTHLGAAFGVFQIPSLDFTDWSAEVDIRPGRQTAVIDDTRIFYDAFAKLTTLSGYRNSTRQDRLDRLDHRKEVTYQLQDGRTRTLTLEVKTDRTARGAYLGTLRIQDGSAPAVVNTFSLPLPTAEKSTVRQEFTWEGLKLDMNSYLTSDSYSLSWDLKRTDLDAEDLQRN